MRRGPVVAVVSTTVALALLAPMPEVAQAASSGQFRAVTTAGITDSSWDSIDIGDLDGDGRDDLVGYDSNGDQFSVRYQLEDGSLGAEVPLVSNTGVRSSIEVGDVIGDADPDLVIGLGGAIRIYESDGAGGVVLADTLSSTVAEVVRIADLDGDGRNDLAAVGWSEDYVTVHLRRPEGGWGAPQNWPVTMYGYNHFVTGDLNGDGAEDLVTMSGQGGSPRVHVLYQTSPGAFGAAAPVLPGTGVPGSPTGDVAGVTAGDVTGDGIDDLAVGWDAPLDGYGLAVFPGGLAGLGEPRHYDVPFGPGDGAALDVDGDGVNELVVQGPGLLVFAQDGAGGLLPPTTYTGASPGFTFDGFDTGDLDGDGQPDVATGSSGSGVRVYYHRAPDLPPTAGEVDRTTTRGANVAVPLVGADAGGDPITFAVDPPGPSNGTLTGTAPNLTYRPTAGFVGDDSFTYTVRDDRGGAAIGTVVVHVLPVVPSRPVAVTGTATDGTADLEWDLPADDGGSPLTAISVRRDGAVLAELAADAESFHDAGLVDATTYRYDVVAHNAVGASSPSAPIDLTPRRRSFPHRRFADVARAAWYADALDWAAYHEMLGAAPGRPFRPNGPVRRSRVVQSLWQLAGRPASVSTYGFVDVPDGAPYQGALDWAIEQDLVRAFPGARFRPNQTVTRGQAVMWSWEALGAPAEPRPHGYSDVPSTFDPAVNWAHAHDLLSGYPDGRFGTTNTLRRKHLFAMLHATAGTAGAWSAWGSEPYPPAAWF